MAWPWIKESAKLYDKADAYTKLSRELAEKAAELKAEQNNIMLAKDGWTADERRGSGELAGALNERYQDVAAKNDAAWNDLPAHFQSGIDKLSKDSLDANDLAAKYSRLAAAAEEKEAQETQEALNGLDCMDRKGVRIYGTDSIPADFMLCSTM